ncbi:MAG: NAD(P)/FAD-dependent oxidoreductase [Lachnospiraceae bacterium]|nr:NAD(P)/FAD-dependent oxidoreductase [Lachnospiraceae bacterium]
MKKVIVIGGGAAGMLAAIAAAQNGHEVHLFEKNEKLGKKLFITGKGRCNLTNASDFETFFRNIVTNPKFLYSALYGFTNEQIVELIEKNGVPTKVERGGRVFPASDKSSDVIRALTRELERQKVFVHLNTEVAEIFTEEADRIISAEKVGYGNKTVSAGKTLSAEKAGSGRAGITEKPEKVAGIRLRNGEIVRSDAVIVATGGVSYKSTGSTGDGIAFANRLGIRTTRLRPALVPLVSDDDVCPRLMGLSLKNVRIKIREEACPAGTEGQMRQEVIGNENAGISCATVKGKTEKKRPSVGKNTEKRNSSGVLYEDFGEMIFTHFGVSGPVILSAASRVGKELEQRPLILEIDLKPALDEAMLDHRLLREIKASPKKQVRHMLEELLPKKMIPVIVSRTGIPEEQRAGEITKEQRRQLLDSLKAFRIRIRGTRGFDEAIITQGGVDVKEINAHTMEARKIPGLYFAGEVLDVDALTGGYNLQIAWSTGWLAGTAVSAAR